MSLDTVAKEVYRYIRDVSRDDKDDDGVALLLPWSLVSREFLHLSREELLSNLELTFPSDHYYTFFELLQSPRCTIPRTQGEVRFCGLRDAIGDTSALSAFKDNMPIFFRYFQKVEALLFVDYYFGRGILLREWNTQPFRVRSNCAFGQLLLTGCVFDSTEAYVQTVAGLASRSRSLKMLRLDDVWLNLGTVVIDDDQMHVDPNPNTETPPVPLNELPALRQPLYSVHITGQSDFTSGILPWLHQNRPMLRQLELCDLQRIQSRQWNFFVDIIAASECLDYLSYGFCESLFPIDEFSPPVDLSTPSKTLSYLSIYRTLNSNGMAPEPNALDTIDINSPLEDITLRFTVYHPNDLAGIDLRRVDSIIASKNLGNLRRVHIEYEGYFEEEGYVSGPADTPWEGLESVERKIRGWMPRLEEAGILHVRLEELRGGVLIEERG